MKKSRKRLKWVWNVLFIFAIIALSLDALFFSSSFIWTDGIKHVLNWPIMESFAPFFTWLGCHIKQKPAAAMISLVGTTGIVIAWLVAAADREVLGVSIAELTRWAYPRLYLSYFICLLPLMGMGIYAGNVDNMRVTAAWSLIVVVLITACFLWSCYRLLLNPKEREVTIYEFYKSELDDASKKRKKNSNEGDTYDSWRAICSVLQRTALCAKQQLTERTRFRSEETYDVWTSAIQQLLLLDAIDQKPTLFSSFSVGKTNSVIECILQMENTWQTLISPPMPFFKQKIAVQEILQKVKGIPSEAETILTAGLVLAIYDIHRTEQDPLLMALDDIMNLLQPLDQRANNHDLLVENKADFLWAFGMLVATEILWLDHEINISTENNQSQTEKFRKAKALLIKISPFLSDENQAVLKWEFKHTIKAGLEKSSDIIFSGSKESVRELLMWYVEWGINFIRPGSTTKDYLFLVSKQLGISTYPELAHHFNNPCYHERLILSLID